MSVEKAKSNKTINCKYKQVQAFEYNKSNRTEKGFNIQISESIEPMNEKFVFVSYN